MKERLDVLLVKRNLAESREKAKAVIMSGIVYVDGQKEDKAGSMFDETANVEVRGTTLKYVSRGGLKLEKAMTHFGVTLEGKICMDVGASTGGFTDCMLQNGAVKVYSVDVGHGQLAWKLRNDDLLFVQLFLIVIRHLLSAHCCFCCSHCCFGSAYSCFVLSRINNEQHLSFTYSCSFVYTEFCDEA